MWEKELADAKQKLSQREKEIEEIRNEVSLVHKDFGVFKYRDSSLQKREIEQAKKKELADAKQEKEQEIETLRQEVCCMCGEI